VCLALGACGAPSSGWSLLLITLDTTRADRLGAYGYRAAATPALDALAAQGVRYLRCYSPVPLTLPSHASILTGLLPPRHGVHANGTQLLADEAVTLAERLRERGHATGAVIGAFVLDGRFGLAQGFEHYDDDLAEGASPSRFGYTERDARRVTDRALRWLERHAGGRFFLWVHYFDPHAPYAPPGYDGTLPVHLPYDAELEFVDRELARLLAELDRSGAAARTLVVATADHGEALLEHGEATHGLFAYEATLRVPLLVRFPDARAAGHIVEQPVSLVDLVPSILLWLGAPVPADLDGEPLPLRDATPGADPRALYFENEGPAQLFGWSPLWGIVLGDRKFIQAPRPELYDLRADPAEARDLYREDAESRRMADRFTEALEALEARPALRASPGSLRDEERARIEALGYLAGGAPVPRGAWRRPEGADPKDRVAVYHRIHVATTLIDAGRTEEGVRTLGDVIESEDPTNRRALSILAGLALEPAARAAAIEGLSRARPTGDPGLDLAVQGRLGQALLAAGRFEEAERALERARAIDPTSAAVRAALEQARSRAGSRGVTPPP
jgi:arylsulfatase A-like enzyme